MRPQINPILLPYASEPEVAVLLDFCVGRLLRRPGEGSSVDKERLHHIADWLRAAIANDEPWLKNVDDHGRPKKLMKFGSIDNIVREADKAMLKAAQRLKSVKLIDGDEELVEMLADGYYVVRLLTPAALDRESAEMQHCIGDGGYDKNLVGAGYLYLSLRDPQGKAHATLEINDGKIVQLQGKQNAPPMRKYVDLLVPYIRARGLAVDVPASHLGHVVDHHGTWHPIENMPEGQVVSGSLDMNGMAISTLPNGLTVSRHLILRKTPITKLPEGLTVGGDLDMVGTSITELPKDLKVGGSLCLSNSGIIALPEDLSVVGTLYLSFTPITVLPIGLSVGGDLHLNCTEITAFPDGLTVRGDIFIRHLNIAEIPDLPDSIDDAMQMYCADGKISAKDFRTRIMEKRSSIYGSSTIANPEISTKIQNSAR